MRLNFLNKVNFDAIGSSILSLEHPLLSTLIIDSFHKLRKKKNTRGVIKLSGLFS